MQYTIDNIALYLDSKFSIGSRSIFAGHSLSKRILTIFYRKFIVGLGTDKFLRVLMIIVIAGILVVIIWRLVAGAPKTSGDKL